VGVRILAASSGGIAEKKRMAAHLPFVVPPEVDVESEDIQILNAVQHDVRREIFAVGKY